MAKKKALLPRAKSLAERLQTERADLTAQLGNTKVLLTDQDRLAMGLRLIEVKRELNWLYAGGLWNAL